jgi:hypothetical protein
MKKKLPLKSIEKHCEVNDVIELVFLDHSSGNSWSHGSEILEAAEFECCLVGYYIGSTKDSYRFGMAYAAQNGTYAPYFIVLKKDVLRWRKRNVGK